MHRASTALALALALAASSAALAHGLGHGPGGGKPGNEARGSTNRPAHPTGGPGPSTPAPRTGKGAPTLHLAQACVVEDATADGVRVRTLSANRHLRRALGGGDTFTVRLGEGTAIRLVGRARHGAKGARPPKTGTASHLVAGVWVTVHVRAPRGTAAADLPAASRIISHGPGRRCALPAAPPEDTPPSDATPPPVEETDPEL